MKKEKKILVRIHDLVGMLYLPPHETKSAILVAKGGPSFGDSGESPLWEVAKKYKRILFIPDYIGCCRSSGIFNFRNCVKTLEISESFLRGEIDGIDTQTGEILHLSCEDIVLLGSSWGASMSAFLEKYTPSRIEVIGLVKALTDWKTQGKTQYIEENTDETKEYIINGWREIYRGFENSEWPDIFDGKLSEYNPIENIKLLKDKRIFVCQGKEDTSIHWTKSKKYYDELTKQFPHAHIQLNIMEGGHESQFTAKALDWILKNIQKKGGENNDRN